MASGLHWSLAIGGDGGGGSGSWNSGWSGSLASLTSSTGHAFWLALIVGNAGARMSNIVVDEEVVSGMADELSR